jgi:hypothetical protein
MQQPLPKSVTDFKTKHPAVWEAFATLGDRCHAAGPLDEKTRRATHPENLSESANRTTPKVS